MGPYRRPAEPPERFERYWQMLERRRKLRRCFRPLVAALALGVLVLIARVWVAAAETRPEPPPVASALASEPWGFVIAASHSEPWTDLHPKAGQPPDASQSPFANSVLQRALASSAEGIRRCYVYAIPDYTPRRGPSELSGDLIVTVHIRDEHRVIVVSGDQSLRVALASCIERELESVQLPSPIPCVWTRSPARSEERSCDILWFNFPLRFTRS